MKTWLYELMKSIRLVRSCPDFDHHHHDHHHHHHDQDHHRDDEFVGISDTNSRVIASRLRSVSDDHRRRKPSCWDDQRAVCVNCRHVFLKFLGTDDEYCSVDCRSNTHYLHGIHDQIARVTMDEDKKQQEQAERTVSIKAAAPRTTDSDVAVVVSSVSVDCRPIRIKANTYKPRQCKLPPPPSVNWTFSAVY